MPCLREQDPQQNKGGYYSDKLSSLLPEMQAGKIDRSEKSACDSGWESMEKRYLGERNDTTIRGKGH